MSYKIFEGKDHYKNKPLYQVYGIFSDYVGEWHTDKKEAEKEKNELNNSKYKQTKNSDKW